MIAKPSRISPAAPSCTNLAAPGRTSPVAPRAAALAVALAVGLAAGLSGCSFGLEYHVDPVPFRLTFTPAQEATRVAPELVTTAVSGKGTSAVAAPDHATATALGLTATARYLGPGQPIVTSRSFLGNIVREVDPYGDDQILFDVEVHNASDSLADIQPQAARLVVPHEAVAARTLQDYKRAWPTYPIENEDMARDQAAAFSYVLQTLLLEQRLMTGDDAEGWVAFVAPAGAQGPATLELPVMVGSDAATLSFAFKVAVPVSSLPSRPKVTA